MTFSSVHSISHLQKRSRNSTTPQLSTTLQDKSITNENEGKRAASGDVSRCPSRPALTRRSNTDSAPEMSVTLLRKQLLIRYVITSPVHTVTIRCYGTRKRYKCVTPLCGQRFVSGTFTVALYTPSITRSF
jgi:hypothetical protein